MICGEVVLYCTVDNIKEGGNEAKHIRKVDNVFRIFKG